MTRSFNRLLVTLVAVGALAGCGKAAAPSTYGVVDSVFTKLPAKQAQRDAAADETKRRETSTSKPETTKVGAPTSDGNG